MDQSELIQELRSLPRKMDQALPALLLVQRRFGYVPEWAIEQIAIHTRRTASDIDGIASAYPDIRRTPAAQHTIRVCTGAACLTSGACEIMRRLEADFGLVPGSQGAFFLAVEECDCLFACALAPVIDADGVPTGRADADNVAAIVRQLTATHARTSNGEAGA